MGKSTTAQMFVDEGAALWDADAAVHRLYAKGGAAIAPLAAQFPQAIEDGVVSRPALRKIIEDDSTALSRIEKIVHPLVAADRAAFLAESTAEITVLDVPLLFETGADALMDAVVCVSIPQKMQMERVLARGTMTEEQFRQIRDKQMPNAEKCARSDYVVVTDTLEHARQQVQDIVQKIREQTRDA